MDAFALLTALTIGLAGSVHCIGMCGGLAGNLLFSASPQVSRTALLFSYNFGRILSYVSLGAIMGFLAQSMIETVYETLYFFRLISAIFVILMGLYIAGLWSGLRHFEALFIPLFNPLKRISQRFLPLNNAAKAIPYGIIWGWLPCGLVYSTLAWSTSSGSALQSAANMGFFGLGTLPGLVAVSMTTDTLKVFLLRPPVRLIVGILIFTYGVVLLYWL